MRFAACAFVFLFLLPATAYAQGWQAQGEGRSVLAGTVIDGALAGLRLACAAEGIELRLTHNGASFDRAREHTVIITVDGLPHVLAMRAVDGTSGDDFRRRGGWQEAEQLLSALARGRELEISAPSGRYRLPLDGSARSIAALRQGCAG